MTTKKIDDLKTKAEQGLIWALGQVSQNVSRGILALLAECAQLKQDRDEWINDSLDLQNACIAIDKRNQSLRAQLDTAAKASPDDIRSQGWAVAIHDDYTLNGKRHTFWLFTMGNRCVKGEGESDADALDKVRSTLAMTTKEQTLEDFVKAVNEEAVRRGYPSGGKGYASETGLDAWRSYWKNGYTPATALDEDWSYE